MIFVKILFLFFSFNIMSLNAVSESFIRANELCASGEFKSAVKVYQGTANKSAAVWYNLGNCYFYQDDYVRAIWAWRRACKIGTRYECQQSRYNISAAQGMLGLKKDFMWYEGVIDFFYSHVMSYSLFFYQLIFLLLLYTSFVMLMFSKKNTFSLKTVIVVVLLCFFSLVVLFFKFKKEHNLHIIVRNKSSIVVGPGNDYHVIGNVELGQEFNLLQDEKSWCYIKGHGVEGWVSKKDLLKI